MTTFRMKVANEHNESDNLQNNILILVLMAKLGGQPRRAPEVYHLQLAFR